MIKNKRASRREIPILTITASNELATIEAISESPDFITFLHTETPKAIKEAIRTRKQVATLFEVGSENSFIELKKIEWEVAIDACIAYQSKVEKYELCIELQDLKTEINKLEKQIA